MFENLPCWTRTLWMGHCRTHRSFSRLESSSAVSSAPLLRLLSLTWCRPSRLRPETSSSSVKLLTNQSSCSLSSYLAGFVVLVFIPAVLVLFGWMIWSFISKTKVQEENGRREDNAEDHLQKGRGHSSEEEIKIPADCSGVQFYQGQCELSAPSQTSLVNILCTVFLLLHHADNKVLYSWFVQSDLSEF